MAPILSEKRTATAKAHKIETINILYWGNTYCRALRKYIIQAPYSYGRITVNTNLPFEKQAKNSPIVYQNMTESSRNEYVVGPTRLVWQISYNC